MARFDVYKVNPLSSVPLVLDVQADLLSDLQTRVVIPLEPHKATKRPTQPRLEPVLQIGGRKYVLMAADIRTVQLADPVANLDNQRTTIIDAIDFLLQGF